jgi:hypothetical protein
LGLIDRNVFFLGKPFVRVLINLTFTELIKSISDKLPIIQTRLVISH